MGFNVRLLMCALPVILLFTGCKSTPVKPETKTPEQQQQESSELAQQLLDRAAKAPPEEKLALLLNAAEKLAHAGDTAWARSIINNLPINAYQENARTPELQAKEALIQSYIAAAEGFYPLAYEQLNTELINQHIGTLPIALAQSIYRLRAQLLFDMEYYTASAEQRVMLSDVLTSGSEEGKENENLIWQTLMEIPLNELKKYAKNTSNRELMGWYLLASLSKNNQTNLRLQIQQLDTWIAEWPDHPASLVLPADLQLLRQLLADQPKQLALLLPFTGKLGSAGSAIRDGILAAYYETQKSGGETPQLRFYNTDNVDINTLYDQAILDGAQMVIGPLSKDNILELSLRPEMPVPTLALNAIDNPLAAIPNLYQFGLGVEDEARQAAQKAWRDGHRRALIIAPYNVWGDRSVEAFTEQWRLLGGELTSDYRFEDTNDYVKVIKRALQLDSSIVRSKEIRAIVGSVEFEPRRRQDVDMIFLAAQAAQARQVKPTLAFHYASDIPVYGTSQVYSGQANQKQDQDMDGVKFPTLPWTFNNQLAERAAIKNHGDNSANLQPLYAMGVDCFYLYPRLKQLENVKRANFYGQTGRLKLNDEKQFVRTQVWAEFRGGIAKPLAESH